MKHSLKEIERYYASKAKRSPHVVGHYAAGARVFGLTDKELRKTWKEFSHASKGKDSPYAQPLDFVVDDHNGKCLKTIRAMRRRKKKSINEAALALEAEENAKKFVFKLKEAATAGGGEGGGLRRSSVQSNESTTGSGRNGRRSVSGNKEPTEANETSNSLNTIDEDGSSAEPNASNQDSSLSSPVMYGTATGGGGGVIFEKQAGWTPRHRLPITNVKLPKYTRPKERKFTIRDMDEIRQRVNDVRDVYYNHLSKEKITKAKEYWHSLKTDQIPSDRLQTNFKKVFRCYSPTNDKEYRSQSPRRKNKNPIQDLEVYKSNGNFVF